MSTESRHTPGPWTISEDRPIEGRPGVVIKILSSDPRLAVGLVGYFEDEARQIEDAISRATGGQP